MKRLKHIVLLLVLSFICLGGLTSFYVPAESIQIRVFSHLKINEAHLSVYLGTYKVYADGVLVSPCNPGMDFKLSVKNDSVEVYKNGELLGVYQYVKFTSDSGCELKLKLSNPDRKPRVYQDDLGFGTSEGFLKIINDVVLDNYIAGVTEAEAGSRSAMEFYKVQAILARTFALAHVTKHSLEGYSLCDQVHCQAYYGKPKDQTIFKALEDTKGKVVVDENLNLITAAFHSNSGGQTANSEDVWGSKTTYLRSIPDSFSIQMPNARWQRKMLAEDWLSYLRIKHNFPVDDKEARELALNFKQENRKTFLECSTAKVPLKNVRLDLQLKSTFFSISPLGKDSILIEGRGYGHGLGMCQEGAMRMVKMGYNYEDVLDFYYRNIQMIDLHKLSFFKDE